MRGFKSFPDQVEVRLESGVAVVVGPNGSGKSNIADALVWASGSLAPSELRAEKPDDVLFAGSAGRPPADFCEVELLFDNADQALPGLDFSEVSIVRRLHRGGEGQYLVNGAQVRRLDVVELLADVGLGAGAGSIVSQGKVEAILTSSAVDRRSRGVAKAPPARCAGCGAGGSGWSCDARPPASCSPGSGSRASRGSASSSRSRRGSRRPARRRSVARSTSARGFRPRRGRCPSV